MYNYANHASLHENLIVKRNGVKRGAGESPFRAVMKIAPSFRVYDSKPDRSSIYQEVLSGFEKNPKELNLKFTYIGNCGRTSSLSYLDPSRATIKTRGVSRFILFPCKISLCSWAKD
ncbi:MAG: hypothetical protein ACT4QE_06725 [Anaerolineales bacterium]